MVEVLPLPYRSTAAGIAVAVRWLGAFIVAQIYNILQESNTTAELGAEAIILLLLAVFSCYAFGETRGRSLEHIDMHLRRTRFW